MSIADPTFPGSWRTVPEYPGYRVCDDGSVWSCWVGHRQQGWRPDGRWRQLKPSIDKDGYESYRLKNANGYKNARGHRLVLELFVGPCPEGMVAAHNNGIRNDNKLGNLRWATQLANVGDKIAHGTAQRGERHAMSKLNENQVLEIRRRKKCGESTRSLAIEFGIAKVTAEFIISRRLWKHLP